MSKELLVVEGVSRQTPTVGRAQPYPARVNCLKAVRKEQIYEQTSYEVGRAAGGGARVGCLWLQDDYGRATYRNTHPAHCHVSPAGFCRNDQRHDSWDRADLAAIRWLWDGRRQHGG